MRTGEITVGIVGAGQITTGMHLPVLLSMPEVRVAWLTDARAERAAQAGWEFGVPALALPERLERLPEAGVVLVAIPYGARGPLYDALASRRCAMYVEKPFARSVAEHERHLQCFSGRAVACGFQRRSSGAVRTLADLVRSEMFGPLRAVRIGHGTTGSLAGSAHSADLGLTGGGILLEVGIHLLDAALFAIAAQDVRVEEGRMIRDSGFDIHTAARGAVATGRGGDVPLDIVVSGLEDTLQGIECRFEHGAVLFSTIRGAIEARPSSGEGMFLVEPPGGPYPSTAYQMCHAHWSGFLESARTGRPNWTSASDSVLTTRLVEGLYALGEGA